MSKRYQTNTNETSKLHAANKQLKKELAWRSKAEADLRKWKYIFTHAEIGFVLVNTDGIIMEVNPTYCRINGYNHEEELVGSPLEQVIDPKNLENAIQNINHLYETGHAAFTAMNCKKDGTTFPVFVDGTLIYNETQHVEYAFYIVQDISEKEHIQVKLREMKSMLDTVFNESRVGMAIVDIQGNIVNINPALRSMFGYSEDELKQMTFVDLTHPDDIKKDVDRFEKVIRGEISSYSIEKRYLRKDDVLIWGNLTAAGLPNPETGAIDFLIGIVDDITEKQKNRTLLEHSHHELKQSNAELEKFAYIASHDLQEPLRTISSFLQLLERNYFNHLDDQAIDYIQRIIQAAKRMQLMIDDLLSYSRVTTHPNTRQQIDSDTELDQVLQDMSFMIQSRDAQIVRETVLPSIYADAVQFRRVLLNLITNAIKYGPVDSPPVIRIGASESPSTWEFWIQDNGIGIDARYFERIFEVFQRLHTQAEYGGTGIGLALCKKIIEQHGGTIWVTSEQGLGSTFYFTIANEIPSPQQ